MKRYQFRDIFSKFCKEQGFVMPGYDKRTIIFNEYKDSLNTAPVEDCEKTLNQFLWNSNFNLAPLPKAVPQTVTFSQPINWVYQEEGKTPMRYNDNYASASITTSAVSDAQIQREYLLNRLMRAVSPKETELYRLFNMNADNNPKTFKDLIDAIKNDKFSVDRKVQKKLDNLEDDQEPWFWGPLYGIIWDGKQPDQDGYHEALNAKDKQYNAAKDIIMTGDAPAGLKALQDFEAWTPTVATTTVN